MPRKLSDQAKKNKASYDIQYAHDHVTRKFIPFNRDNPEEARMLEWLNQKGKGNVAGYVKGLIRDDMIKAGE